MLVTLDQMRLTMRASCYLLFVMPALKKLNKAEQNSFFHFDRHAFMFLLLHFSPFLCKPVSVSVVLILKHFVNFVLDTCHTNKDNLQRL